MMIHSKPTARILLSLALSLPTLADNTPPKIAGCTALDCPNDGWDSCTVADETYVGVGVSRIADTPTALGDISLVKGVNISSSPGDPRNGGGDGGSDHGADESRPYRSVYYLGTPENLDVSSLSGCAVVFNDPPTEQFDTPKVNRSSVNTDIQASTGTCPDVIEQSCIDALTRQARGVDYQSSSGNACSSLERDLRDNAPKECSDLTGAGDGLGNFTVVSLGGLSAISSSQNSSSDCWPVLPKSDNLVLFAEDTVMGNYTNEGNLAEVYKITPILTVFTSANSSNDDPSAQLTCLKVVTTQNTEDAEGTGEDAAPLSTASMVGVSVATFVAVMFTLL
ncbi:uncharacterized protein BJX67DRAFT_346672 [Aspergillus lucknowensis]|uniref:Uncharacterized protein n=1 Tax=Aspergillus lucknowensis TaxID=176173 RepID=A0ABR4M065_9EURO